MKTSISCAAAVLALSALAGGAQAQLVGGATTMANGTVHGALSAATASSALSTVSSTKATALSTAGSNLGAVNGRVADTAGLARDQVMAAKTQGLAAARTLDGDVRSVQGQLAQGHQIAAGAGAYGGATADLVAGDVNAVFRDYAGFTARTPGIETRDATDKATGTVRLVATRARGEAGDVIILAHNRADQVVDAAHEVRDTGVHRTRATTRRVVAAAHDAGQATPSVHVSGAGSAKAAAGSNGAKASVAVSAGR